MIRRLALLFALLATPAVAEPVTLYTAADPEFIGKAADAIGRALPDVPIDWQADAAPVLVDRLMADTPVPEADMVWGVPLTSLLLLDHAELLAPFDPSTHHRLHRRYIDRHEPPRWTGQWAEIAAICYNWRAALKQGVAPPTRWQDLTRPEYKGLVTMPDPISASEGFMSVSAWLQLFGDEQGWAFMDKLNDNIAFYTHDGARPCNLAAEGKYPIGISFLDRAVRLRGRGAPIEILLPEEGLGWEIRAFALLQGAADDPAVTAVAEWSASAAANRLYAEDAAEVAMPRVALADRDFPAEAIDRLIANDFPWAAANKARILKVWFTRYGGRSELE